MVSEVWNRVGSLLVSLTCEGLMRLDIPRPSTLLPPFQTSSLGAGRPGGG
jgi:hypothetical protein